MYHLMNNNKEEVLSAVIKNLKKKERKNLKQRINYYNIQC
jgi:hypothetical protein